MKSPITAQIQSPTFSVLRLLSVEEFQKMAHRNWKMKKEGRNVLEVDTQSAELLATAVASAFSLLTQI